MPKDKEAVKRAEEMKKIRDQAEKDHPDSVSATPTMVKMIEWADSDTDEDPPK